MGWKEIINGSGRGEPGRGRHLLGRGEEVALFRDIERGREARGMRVKSPVRERERQAVVDTGSDAVVQVVRANIGLVVKVAARYQGLLEWDDLVQEGLVGLLRAIEKYDYRRGLRFSTLAVWWVRQGISRAVASCGRTIRLPERRLSRVVEVERKRYNLAEAEGEMPSVGELALELGWSEEEVWELMQDGEDVVSLDSGELVGWQIPHNASGSGGVRSVVEAQVETEEMQLTVERLLSQLPLEMSGAVMHRYGLASNGNGNGGDRRRRSRLVRQGVGRMRKAAEKSGWNR